MKLMGLIMLTAGLFLCCAAYYLIAVGGFPANLKLTCGFWGAFATVGFLILCFSGATSAQEAQGQNVPTPDPGTLDVSTPDPGTLASVTPVSDTQRETLQKQAGGHDASVFAQRLGNDWICVCGATNPFDTTRAIQNCGKCRRNRDFVLQNCSRDAIEGRTTA